MSYFEKQRRHEQYEYEKEQLDKVNDIKIRIIGVNEV